MGTTEPGKWVKPIHMWIVAIILLAAAIATSQISPTIANSDYICTKIVEAAGSCTNGAWGAWETISESTAGGLTTTTSRRIYTGTRAVSRTFTYLNLRTSCDVGYTQSSNGDSTGASGFHSGNISTQYSACQIEETKVQGGSSATGGSSRITAQQRDMGTSTVTQQVQEVSSLAELNALSGSVVAGSGAVTAGNSSAELQARPTLVRSGDTTLLTWGAAGVASCVLTGTNGDRWTTLSGTQHSSALHSQTTFRLVCARDEGEELATEVVVSIVPQFQEQ